MLKYVFLGFIQGLTEFLPVSSSGHLVILQNLLGIRGEELTVIIFLHLATALATAVFFIKEIIAVLSKPKMIVNIIIVTAITGLIAIAGKNFFASLFSSARLVAVALLITGIILILSRNFNVGEKSIEKVTRKDSVVLGIVQAIAIIPGISRSGITITTLLFRGFSAENAFKFSFLAAIPVIWAGAILELKDLRWQVIDKAHLTAGFISSFIVGLFALAVLRRMMIKGKLYYFGFYCILVSLATFIFLR